MQPHYLDQRRPPLESQGFGPSKPIETNDTPEGCSSNRRVELIIVEKETPPPSALILFRWERVGANRCVPIKVPT